jgi:hypothetical protein
MLNLSIDILTLTRTDESNIVASPPRIGEIDAHLENAAIPELKELADDADERNPAARAGSAAAH